MSRGPGHLTKAIAEHLAAHPSGEFTIGELAAIAYPGVPIDKKHRVATARAVNKLAPERLRRREHWELDPVAANRLDEIRRAVNWVGRNRDIATITLFRDVLASCRVGLADAIYEKRRRGEP